MRNAVIVVLMSEGQGHFRPLTMVEPLISSRREGVDKVVGIVAAVYTPIRALHVNHSYREMDHPEVHTITWIPGLTNE